MTSEIVTDIAIVGAGPAGYTAGIYAARAGKITVLVEGMEPGGQLTITTDIENFPGFAEPVSGPELMNSMKIQAERVGTKIIGDIVEKVDLSKRPFKIFLASEKTIKSKTLIIATGATATWLGLSSEKEFVGKGVSACATCDGFFYREKKVAVIGGGDTACEEADYLTNHASRVFLVHRRDELRASKIMAKRVLANPKIKPLWNKTVDEVIGDEAGVNGILLNDTLTGEKEVLKVDGMFVAIGHKPNTQFLAGALKCDLNGYIITEPGTTRTSVKGVFAAGDVQDSVYRQAVTAAGTGCMAAISASRLIESEES